MQVPNIALTRHETDKSELKNYAHPQETISVYVTAYSMSTDQTLNTNYWKGATEDLEKYRRNTELSALDRLRTFVGEGAEVKARLDANTTLILQRFRADGNSLLATLQVGQEKSFNSFLFIKNNSFLYHQRVSPPLKKTP